MTKDLIVEGLDEKVILDFKHVAEWLNMTPSELLEGLMREFVIAMIKDEDEEYEGSDDSE